MTSTPEPAPQPGLSLRLDQAAWLPVTYTDGTTTLVSLRTLLVDAHLIASIDGFTPPGYASLWRILTTLTYRVTGLDDAGLPFDDWHTHRQAILNAGHFDPQRVGAYFTQWGHRFDLFDAERPWRQDPRLATQVPAPAGLTTLVPDRPAGNAPAFFSDYHTANPGIASIAEAVDAMLVRQFYAPTGRCQSRTLPGRKASANFTCIGPLRGRVSYHPLAPTVFGTLLAHLIPPITLSFAEPGTPDLAEWEADLPNPDQPKPYPTGIVSLLANDSGHAVLLVPGADTSGQVCVTTGYWTWRFTDKSAGNLVGWDPYLAYRTDPKRGAIARIATPGRDMWRDLPALLADPEGATRAPDQFDQPAVLKYSVERLPEQMQRTLRMAAYAYYQDLAQPKDVDWASAVMPAVFRSADIDPSDPDYAYRTAVPAWVTAAESEGRTLGQALFRALRDARNLDPKGKAVTAWSATGAPIYWRDAYTLFDTALSESGSGAEFSATVPAARSLLRAAALGVYDQVTATVVDARGLMSVLRHRPRELPTGASTVPDSDSTPATGTAADVPAKDAA